MITYTNECVDCGKPCLGRACPNSHVAHFKCDGCGDEVGEDELFDYDDKALCIDCIKARLTPAYSDYMEEYIHE